MLTSFAVDYIEQNLENKTTKKDGSQLRDLSRLKTRLGASLKENLNEIYHTLKSDGSGLRRCSFFDPLVPNGGPRPLHEMKKRDAWIWEEYAKLQGPPASNDNGGRKRRSAAADFDEYDPFDVFWNTPEAERSTVPRLSPDPALALRQVKTTVFLFCKKIIL